MVKKIDKEISSQNQPTSSAHCTRDMRRPRTSLPPLASLVALLAATTIAGSSAAFVPSGVPSRRVDDPGGDGMAASSSSRSVQRPPPLTDR
jgi:hypothetical protein